MNHSVAWLMLLLSAPSWGAYRSIRNANCAPDEDDARIQIFTQIAGDRKLCGKDAHAAQTGGWSCHSGRDCPAKKFRCATQYRCVEEAIDLSPRVHRLKSTPTPSSKPVANFPQAQPNPKPSREVLIIPDRKSTPSPSPTPIHWIPQPGALHPVASPAPDPALPSPTGDTAIEYVKPVLAPWDLLKAIGKCEPSHTTIASTREGETTQAEVAGFVGPKCRVVLTSAKRGTITCLFSQSEREEIGAGSQTTFQASLVDESICGSGGR